MMKVAKQEFDKQYRLTFFETKDGDNIYTTYITYYKNSFRMSEETNFINGNLESKFYYDEKGRIVMMKNCIKNNYIIFAYDDNWSRNKPAFQFHYNENDEIKAEYHYGEEVAA